MINQKNHININEVKNNIYDTIDIKIYLEENNIYSFEVFNKLFTDDVLEAVSYLTKHKKLEYCDFWDFKVTEEMMSNINPMNTVYWLSGGDEFWDNWNFNWSDNIELYSDRFKKSISDIKNVKTLNDIREIIFDNYNLDNFYEFALKNNII